MSAATARATPRPAAPTTPATRAARPALRLVRSPRRTARRLPFVLVVVVLLAVGLVGLLLLSMQRAQASFELGRLQSGQSGLADQVQALQRQVEQDADPTRLAAGAAALGMVPETSTGFLDARGHVIGPVPSGAPVPAPGARAVDGVVVAGRAPTLRAAALPDAVVAPPVAARPSTRVSGGATPTAPATVTAPKSTPTPTPTPTVKASTP